MKTIYLFFTGAIFASVGVALSEGWAAGMGVLGFILLFASAVKAVNES